MTPMQPSPRARLGRALAPALVAGILLATGASPLRAQAADAGVRAVPAGARVRLILPEVGPRRLGIIAVERRVDGAFVGATADSIFLRPHPAAGVVAVPRTQVRSAWQSDGYSRWREALRHGLQWAAMGAIIAYQYDHGPQAGDRTRSTVHSLAWGAYLGGGTGAAMAALFPHERWQRAPLP